MLHLLLLASTLSVWTAYESEESPVTANQSNLIHHWGTGLPQMLVSTNTSQILDLAAGKTQVMALHADGRLTAWGTNRTTAAVPDYATNITAISAGAWHNLALRLDGTILTWGSQYWGETTVPKDAQPAIQIAAGYGHSLALKPNGSVVTWGAPITARLKPGEKMIRDKQTSPPA